MTARSRVVHRAATSSNYCAQIVVKRLARKCSSIDCTDVEHLTRMWSHPTIVSWFARYFRSSIGAKQVMAVTGLLLLLFAIVHMLGHLQMFGGQDMYNAYAHFLQDLWEVKWPTRVGLLVLVVIHIAARHHARRSQIAPRATRSTRCIDPVISRGPGRTMAISGLDRRRVSDVPHPALHDRPDPAGVLPPARLRRVATTRTRCSSTGSRTPASTSRTSSASACSALHLGHGAASWLQSLGLAPSEISERSARGRGSRRSCSSVTWCRRPRCWPGSSGCREPRHHEVGSARADRSDRPAMDQGEVRLQAGQPGQQAQVQGHRRRHRASRARAPRRRSPSSATTSRASAFKTRRAARTRSPRRAASTPRRTTRTTATACTGCSTTPSRAATSARASRTCTGSPRSR